MGKVLGKILKIKEPSGDWQGSKDDSVAIFCGGKIWIPPALQSRLQTGYRHQGRHPGCSAKGQSLLYTFGYLTEYNAILRQFNVYADTGSAQSQSRKHRDTRLYFASDALLTFSGDPRQYTEADSSTRATLYIGCTVTGLLLLYAAIKTFTGFLSWKYGTNIFNRYNESFAGGPPDHQSRLYDLRAQYTFRRHTRDSWINLELYRGTLVMGIPGSGKSRYIFRQPIQQSFEKLKSFSIQ